MDRLDAKMELMVVGAEFVSLLTQARSEKSHAYAAQRAEAIIRGIADLVCRDDDAESIPYRNTRERLYNNAKSLFEDATRGARSHNWVSTICGKVNQYLIYL